jgi:hypothetical protein
MSSHYFRSSSLTVSQPEDDSGSDRDSISARQDMDLSTSPVDWKCADAYVMAQPGADHRS